MPVLKLEDLNIISPSPDNFILKLKIDGKDYNYIGSGEHIYEDVDENDKPVIDQSLITARLAHSSIFEYEDNEISTTVTAWDIFDINDVGVTTDTDDENNDNLLLLQNSNINPSAKTAFPMHQINSNSVYGFVSAISKQAIGIPKVHKDRTDDSYVFNLTSDKSDPITRYHYRPMAVALSSVLGLGTQMNFSDTFDKLFVFDPTDSNRLYFTKSLRNWRRDQSNRDKSSYRVTNNFDFGKLLVRTILFPKATLNNEYSTERQYTEVSSPYSYMRKYNWNDDKHFYSNGSFIVLNSREDNSFEDGFDVSAKPGTMVTSKYSRRFGDIGDGDINEVSPPTPPEVTIELSDNTIVKVSTDYNKVIEDISAINSDIFENSSTFKQYMPELINRENETTSDTSLMTSKHKANIFDIDIKRFWNDLNSSINSIPLEVKADIKDMIKKNLYEMIENIKPAHTKLYRIITNDEGDDLDTSSSSSDPTPVPKKKVTLSFNGNGGLYNETYAIIKKTGEVGAVIGTIDTPEREGYIFDNSYEPAIPSTFPDNNKTYVAKWTPISYTIIYHYNRKDEGDRQIEQHVTYNTSIALREFELEHYNLIGWSRSYDRTTTDYTNRETVSNLTTVNGATVDLYAVWNPISFTVSFHGNGATSGSMPDQYFNYGESKELLDNDFIKEHYDFTVWKDAISSYQNKQIASFSSNTILTAQWIPKTYYVRFNGNGSTSGSMQDQPFVYGITGNLNENTYEKTNYIFDNWRDKDDNEYINGQPISLTSNLDLFANWCGTELSINFQAGEGTTGEMNVQKFNYGDNVTLNSNEFAKAHYEFYKWKDANSPTIEYDNGQTIYNLQSNLDLSATWKPGSFTLSFDNGRGQVTGEIAPQTYTYGDTNARLPNAVGVLSREHYDFAKWIDESGKEYQNCQELSSYDGDDSTLTAQWRRTKYYVVFDGNGSTSGSMDKQMFYYEIPQKLNSNGFARDQYEFEKWIDYDGNTFIDGATIALTANKVLSAVWTPNDYSLTFNYNGGSSDGLTSTVSTVAYDSPWPVAPSIANPKAYKIDFITADSGSTVASSLTYNCPFNGYWSSGNCYYDSMNVPTLATYVKTTDFTVYADWTNPSAGNFPNPSRSNYEFDGWYESRNWTNRLSKYDALSEDKKLYAKWNVSEVTATISRSYSNYYEQGSYTASLTVPTSDITSVPSSLKLKQINGTMASTNGQAQGTNITVYYESNSDTRMKEFHYGERGLSPVTSYTLSGFRNTYHPSTAIDLNILIYLTNGYPDAHNCTLTVTITSLVFGN